MTEVSSFRQPACRICRAGLHTLIFTSYFCVILSSRLHKKLNFLVLFFAFLFSLTLFETCQKVFNSLVRVGFCS